MILKINNVIKRIALSLCAFLVLAVAFTVYANLKVEKAVESRLYSSVDSIPYNKVGLLLGTTHSRFSCQGEGDIRMQSGSNCE